ncbi:MAG TPA: FAD-binding oxidoreductase [Candidatus Binatia bacterium]|nr:FAD-binding oxidoreductase [Candidatus Binatia bacterium]
MPKIEWIDELTARCGAALSDAVATFPIAGRSAACVVSPASVAQVSEVLAFAHERNLAVIPVGNATHLHVGSPPARYDVALSLRKLARIVAHEAADMTVTVEAGCTLDELNAALATAQQWVPLDPPSPDRVTVGGLIAADLNGPLRLSHGKVRDLLIGVTVMLADGSVVKGGGRVVKNVAGYDLCKLFTGSLGTLGVIVEATFKVRPRPEQTRVLWIGSSDPRAPGEFALGLLDTNIAPLFIELLNRHAIADASRSVTLSGASALAIGFGGVEEEITAQTARLTERYGPALHVSDQPDVLMTWLREFPQRNAHNLTARVSMLPTELIGLLPRLESEAGMRGVEVALVAHVGNGVACLRLTSPSETAAVLFCEWLRIAAREHGGWVVFDSLPDSLQGRIDPFGNATPAVLLMRGIKQQLDPRGILSPGRFVGGI